MNLSTSSFKTELKVFLVVLVIVGSLEMRERFRTPRPDSEADMVRHFPMVADNLVSQPGISMVLLGNSLAQNGYDMPLLRTQLESQGNGNLHVEKIAQAGSSPIEWYHNFAVNFVQRGKIPNVIVISMSPSGICDALPAGYRVGWLANETGWGDVHEVLFEDLKNFEVGGQYLQARVSKLYADRWDIRVGVMYKLDRDLWDGMTWINNGQPALKVVSGKSAMPCYSLLSRMLEMALDNKVQVILVAMPAREGYPIDPGLFAILQKYGATFLDCRIIPGLTATCFKDGWHLNSQGATIFTTYMARALPKLPGILPVKETH